MGERRPAGFWIRALAAFIDGTVFFLVQVSYGALAALIFGVTVGEAWTLAPLLWTFTLLFAGVYTAVLHAYSGQTVGKLLMGVRVVALDGEPPSIGPAILRYLAYFVSLAVFGIGFLMAGLRRDKRALHDLIAGTCVDRLPARKPPSPPSAPEPSVEAGVVPADQMGPPVT
jgi:uncharacterized RDD family membrane protein YckC